MEFNFTGKLPGEELYRQWSAKLDRRFAAETIVYATPSKDQSRTWRYSDVQTIASSGAFQLTITTLETQFNFQLKQPITEAGYNELWLQIEKKNGRIQ